MKKPLDVIEIPEARQFIKGSWGKPGTERHCSVGWMREHGIIGALPDGMGALMGGQWPRARSKWLEACHELYSGLRGSWLVTDLNDRMLTPTQRQAVYTRFLEKMGYEIEEYEVDT